MEDGRQKKISPFWHSDVPGLLFVMFYPVVLIILLSMIWPVLQTVERGGAWSVFAFAAASAVAGIVLLFFARLPLYRQRAFFSFGSRLLDAPHRRLYRLAYGFIFMAVLLLLILLTALR